MRCLSPAALLALLLPTTRGADDPAKETPPLQPGHSVHGEAFNEGPRQAAVLMPGMGSVRFPVTTTRELAQRFFEQGVGQLHGFWYLEAERSFRQVTALDPDCAMAYWGMAMANINNPKRAAEFIKSASARKEKASRREQLWIGSLAEFYAESKKEDKEKRRALVTALEDLTFEFPDDLEAKAFLVFQLWENKGKGLPLESRRAVDSLSREVLAANPMHPIHHYRIHLWNAADGDKRAVDSAALCGQAAPGIAHMWHMPGHTFSNLRRYADAAWQQEASTRVDHAHTIEARILPDQIHNFAHNNDWLVKNLNYVGRVHDAIDLAKNMIELPRIGSKSGQSYKMGRDRLLETLQRYELWHDLLALDGTAYLPLAEKTADDAPRIRAVGVAAFSTGDSERGERQIAELEKMLQTAREERMDAADAAETKAKEEKKPDDQINAAIAQALRNSSARLDEIRRGLADLRLTRAMAQGNAEEVRQQLKLVNDISAERQSRIYLSLGDKAEAEKQARDSSKADEAQVQPLANLAWVLWSCEKHDEARQTFEKLRQLSASLDLDVPVFRRLQPIVEDLRLPADWRVAAALAPDAGVRPELVSLGPFRWRPSPAPGWSLSDSAGKQVSLMEYHRRPVLVVFYLGSGVRALHRAAECLWTDGGRVSGGRRRDRCCEHRFRRRSAPDV
jgi:hypothetical protein